MTEPFFSIAIPTKNRPDRVADAVRSVVVQTFPDFEVIVCDNSDDADARRTAAAVQSFGDSRIRYIRTSGQLSMSDNWERAIADARGEFVGILTDRSVFRRDALRIAHDEIGRTQVRCVSWFQDLFGRDRTGTHFKRRPCTLKRYRLEQDVAFDYFVNGHPTFSSKIVPKLMTCVCHRSILEAIRSSTGGRVCLPVAPDFTSGFLILAHAEWVLLLDEALYVSGGTGTGASFRVRGELGDRFRRELSLPSTALVDRMPSAACFSHALVLNDFVRIQELLGDRMPKIALNRAQYYLGCLRDYAAATRRGADLAQDLRLLLDSLERETAEVQQQVRTASFYKKAIARSTAIRRGEEQAHLHSEEEEVDAEEQEGDAASIRFDTVFDALAWDEANPRVPVLHSFLDLMPGYADGTRRRARAKEAERGSEALGPGVVVRVGTSSKQQQQAKGSPTLRRRVRKLLRHQLVVQRARARRARMLAVAAARRARL